MPARMSTEVSAPMCLGEIMSTSIVIAAAAAADLEPAPVVHDEVLNGTPRMRSKTLARSHDGTSHTMVWECTAGCFNWDYHKDETFIVISGEAFITPRRGRNVASSPGTSSSFRPGP